MQTEICVYNSEINCHQHQRCRHHYHRQFSATFSMEFRPHFCWACNFHIALNFVSRCTGVGVPAVVNHVTDS